MELVIGVCILVFAAAAKLLPDDNSAIERYYRHEYRDEYRSRDPYDKHWWVKLHKK